ncbi:dymeclin-like [Xenia sp. Carnegie-2017]|uniref:dymeclin-like n=1 Tax=Xenia sp. Carnegie-2017 TaxID=2897299 RepID=UPI001F049DDB|nr:dymeclin-like [Xenia sp. Carnegie-2017]
MGAKPSSINELKENVLLNRLVGSESIPEGDQFWEELLAFSFVNIYRISDAKLLEEATESLCYNLARNNLKSGNFIKLVELCQRKVEELRKCDGKINSSLSYEVCNSLLLVRSFIKYFIEHAKEEDLFIHFGGFTLAQATKLQRGKMAGQVSQGIQRYAEDSKFQECGLLDDFFETLVEILTEIPYSDQTYTVLLEAINSMIVLLSVQMFDPDASTNSVIYQIVMHGKCSKRCNKLVMRLLRYYIKQDPLPNELRSGGTKGLLGTLISWFGSDDDSTDKENALLSNQSVLLLLILVNHCTQSKKLNLYRQALFTFTNSKHKGGASQNIELEEASFYMNAGSLYITISSQLYTDETTLLLYLLLHRNPIIASYMLSRTDIERLILPILKLLYSAEEQNSHHIYMALIVLLILSQDENFNKSIHEVVLNDVPWFTDRVINNITLGGLLVLVVIRTIQYNMTRMRDKYLHTNCLAALANMSAQFHALHPYVTQRLVSLYAVLAKKHGRVQEQIKQSAANPHQSIDDDFTQDFASDLSILEEVIRMVLEIINSCLTNTLHHNPNLVYTLLHRRELFAQFRTHPTFQDIIQNIDTVLTFFSTRLEQHPDQILSVQVVLDVIKQGTLQWPKDKLKKFPELKFKYVEEEQPEEFFIPYVWSLVYKSARLYWNPEKIHLFHPGS